MRVTNSHLQLSATDLANFLGCRHRTALDLAVAYRARDRPKKRQDDLLDLLIERGKQHERAFVQRLRDQGRSVTDLNGIGIDNRDVAISQTVAAMRAGADVIVQGALTHDPWFGFADVILRVPTPSDLGDWSYEIIDTKLARETRGGTILQLGLYSEMLAQVQGTRPGFFHVVTPDLKHPEHTFRLDDYAAYFRLIRDKMRRAVDVGHEALAAANYPDPVEHCSVCHWWSSCDRRWREDDHLSFVAGISRVQRRELSGRAFTTLTSLAQLGDPLPFKPKRGSKETYGRLRDQARLQLASRGLPQPVFELRPFEERPIEGESSGRHREPEVRGLRRLPEPSPGDVFLDLEGAPYARENGREYLFGVVTIEANGTPEYRAFWGFTDGEERKAFEAVMDLIVDAWKTHETMHVYHYAPYETTAFKRLMGRYATRENELDAMLRSGRFVDLYAVVRQSMLIGIEGYSIKQLEPLYDFTRAVELDDATLNLRHMERALELPGSLIEPEVKAAVEGYNKDDCVSTLRLRDWLEGVRADAIANGTPIPRPVAKAEQPSEDVSERTKRVEALRSRLLEGMPEDPDQRNEEQRARWILAYQLDFHRREDKATWWEYFRLKDLPDEDLTDEPQAVTGLEHVERVHVNVSKKGKPTGPVTDRYRYPLQEMEIGRGDEVHVRDGNFGEVVAADRRARTLDIAKGKKQAELHPATIFAHNYVDTNVLEAAVCAIGDRVAHDGRLEAGRLAADASARDLLLRMPPRLTSGSFRADTPDVAFGVGVVLALDHSTLAVQGPPGAGKTFSGAHMICALVAAGRRVGVTAMSHKALRNLLDEVHKVADKSGTTVRLGHKDGNSDNSINASSIVSFNDNAAPLAALQTRDIDVMGGTAWLWSRPEYAGSVDVLFVDEAGQMSLAHILAVSRAATSMVLLGDPQQLEQPIQGSHPDGVGVSALQHVLGPHQTLTPDRGIFLPETWRLAPSICAFTSELYYERKLHSRPELSAQRLTGTGDFDDSGLWVVDVTHEGNRNSSDEEVEAIAGIVGRLTADGAQWINKEGSAAQLTLSDVLVVAPYNAQVTRLQERLGAGARVGTVDKFQGQEAPVVIYSMATSRPEDAPRGMGFLYSPNRLNVATSRARCAAILVASPALFEPECQTPQQMKLANGVCRYRELAETVTRSTENTASCDT